MYSIQTFKAVHENPLNSSGWIESQTRRMCADGRITASCRDKLTLSSVSRSTENSQFHVNALASYCERLLNQHQAMLFRDDQ